MQGAPKQLDTDLVACASSQVFPKLLPELTEDIVRWMGPNEVPFFRLVNKAAAAQFSGPQRTTVRLSRPVPPNAFAAQWLAPGATRGMTLERRRQLLCLTAASGMVTNLEVAMQAAGCLPTYEVFQAAASAGKLEPCQWLWQQGCPTKKNKFYQGSGILAAAAGGGHRHVCEWLLTLGLTWGSGGAAEAARGGHVGLMEWLWQVQPQLNTHEDVVRGAAYGCDLATLQRFRTPDWAAKVEWLEAQGCPKLLEVADAAAVCPDAASRLAWLRGRGYPLGTGTVEQAAKAGNLTAVQYLLSEAGEEEDPTIECGATSSATEEGHLELLKVLHAAGWCLDTIHSTLTAARYGHLHVLAWLVEHVYNGWSDNAITSAVESGCEEALEWLVARGCPMKNDGSPFMAACFNGDLAMARLLRQLGAPWGPAGVVVSLAARIYPVPMLRWLLEEGCPVGDYEAALAEAGQRDSGGGGGAGAAGGAPDGAAGGRGGGSGGR
ncbi:hypothetical protein GPECTOR_55g290 [Gonium pectorale]|uniref:Ankyrin repeat domain-containing protein n=1 Tax=Gonium pectorale TaxID=33097 RepID=A0A150G6E0_GONPE|nr:hypothetical protein GPECTOR_55g290 [Gonium pectorale]|eukprot:KXZ45384.1 hypothetical protein GPECTOR_55g290 [Gonium pectorale]